MRVVDTGFVFHLSGGGGKKKKRILEKHNKLTHFFGVNRTHTLVPEKSKLSTSADAYRAIHEGRGFCFYSILSIMLLATVTFCS